MQATRDLLHLAPTCTSKWPRVAVKRGAGIRMGLKTASWIHRNIANKKSTEKPQMTFELHDRACERSTRHIRPGASNRFAQNPCSTTHTLS